MLGAERIGHGYHVVDDPVIYDKAIQVGVHFETCPHSSILTGAVKPDVPKHPIVRYAHISWQRLRVSDAVSSLKCYMNFNKQPLFVRRFAEDDVSFSIGTDGPTATNTTLLDEYKLVEKWGLTDEVIRKAVSIVAEAH